MSDSTSRPAILLTDRTGEPSTALGIAQCAEVTGCVGSVGELDARLPLSSVAVLILDVGSVPSGELLAALGRLSVEYPGIQKVAFLSGDPPIEVATWLTACGVEIQLDGTKEGADRVADTIEKLRERARWSVS